MTSMIRSFTELSVLVVSLLTISDTHASALMFKDSTVAIRDALDGMLASIAPSNAAQTSAPEPAPMAVGFPAPDLLRAATTEQGWSPYFGTGFGSGLATGFASFGAVR